MTSLNLLNATNVSNELANICISGGIMHSPK